MRKYILIAVVVVILGFVVAAKADRPLSNPRLLIGYSSSEVTLRDYFAGQFMNGYISGVRWRSPEGLAELSYKYADAMLAERAK